MRAQAIIKNWSEQSEFELAKYATEMLMAFKAIGFIFLLVRKKCYTV